MSMPMEKGNSIHMLLSITTARRNHMATDTAMSMGRAIRAAS